MDNYVIEPRRKTGKNATAWHAVPRDTTDGYLCAALCHTFPGPASFWSEIGAAVTCPACLDEIARKTKREGV